MSFTVLQSPRRYFVHKTKVVRSDKGNYLVVLSLFS